MTSRTVKRLEGSLTCAFYQGMGEGKSWKDKIASWAIKTRTGSKMTHVELVFPDLVSWSSSGMDGGVRYKDITYSHPERWVFKHVYKNVSMNAPEVRHIRANCDMLLGAKYDWRGIFFNQLFPWGRHNSAEFWCSEAVAFVLGLKPAQVSPAKLHKMLCERWSIHG